LTRSGWRGRGVSPAHPAGCCLSGAPFCPLNASSAVILPASHPRTQNGCAGLGRWRIDLFAPAGFAAVAREGHMTSAEHEAMAVERPIGSSNDDGQSCDGRWAEDGFGVLPGASPPAADAVRVGAAGGLRGVLRRIASIANSQSDSRRHDSPSAERSSAHPNWVRGR
jgi:hypothetical protein